MARRGTRKASKGKGRGLFGYIYSPISQTLGAVKNTVSATTNTVRKVTRNTLNGANTVGRKVTGRANAALRGLVPRGLLKRATRRRRRN